MLYKAKLCEYFSSQAMQGTKTHETACVEFKV